MDPLWITQFGAPAAFCLVLIAVVKVLFRRETEAHTRAIERADRYEAELRILNEAMRDRIVPALIEASRVNTEASKAIGEVTAMAALTRRAP